MPPWRRDRVVAHTRVLLDSYARWLGRDLIAPRDRAQEDAFALFHAPFVVVSHGPQADPLLSYGNRLALDLWAMEFETLVGTASRKTAEPVHRDERARMLAQARRQGYFAGYSGVRVARTGARFLIEDALIWNLVGADGAPLGQAATFSRWRALP